MDLLRFSTAGSVDDGKSTLIGRLLFDSKGIFEDQYAAIERTSRRRGHTKVDLALLTDGLRAEREQGITIDVAYRYFATPRRKFIVADTPGHIQYTRNMVTGASTADLAIVLVDARNGVLEQSRRHAFIAALLGIPHIIVAVNKMDLVGYSEEVFEAIRTDFSEWAAKLAIRDLRFIPISALHGDNVVQRSLSMPWYQGPSLLYDLENVYIGSDRNLIDARFPVQWVIRPQSDAFHDFRGYAGQVAGGVFRTGDEVVVLPSGRRTRISRISTTGWRAGDRSTTDVRGHPAGGRHRHLPGRHALPAAQPAEGRPGAGGDGLLDGRDASPSGRPLLPEAHDPDGQGGRGRPALRHGRQHPPPRAGHGAGPERHRTGAAADRGAADARRVPRQPDDGWLHPHR